MNKDLRDKIISKLVGGLLIVSLAVILATLQMELFPNVDWSEVDTTPIYWPETFEPYPEPYVDTVVYKSDNIIYWEWDSVMDSVEMDCGE